MLPSVGVGAFAVIYQFFVFSFLAWCCISVSTALFTNTLLQILSVAILLQVGGRFVLPFIMGARRSRRNDGPSRPGP
jgi:hypothetical protein